MYNSIDVKVSDTRSSVQCTLYSVQCTLYTVHTVAGTLCNVQYTYTVRRTVYVHCTSYTYGGAF